MLRVLIAEDSKTIQRTLQALLLGEPDIQIVGLADNGKQAVEMCGQLRPDLVTMDIFMPEMNGLEATRLIMQQWPTRIVIVSSMVGDRDMRNTFEAMRAGAVQVIAKPTGVLVGNYNEVKNALVTALKEVAATKPKAQMSWLPAPAATAHLPQDEPLKMTPKVKTRSSNPSAPIRRRGLTPEIVAIGGSTGAPTVLLEILSRLPADYPFPILVAQHIARGFASGLASWLDSALALNARVACKGDSPTPGLVLVAPDDCHMTLDANKTVRFSAPDCAAEHIPSVNRLFHSVAQVYGNKAVGVILSGMGKDGAQGLKEMSDNDCITLGQNEDTSVVYGMAKVAFELGAVALELDPSGLANELLKLGNNK